MMTELQFLVHLLLEHKLKPDTKKAVSARMAEVEEALRCGRPTLPFKQHSTEQAPSTQRLMEAQIQLEPPKVLPSAGARIVGGEVNTGSGTRGPRKY